MNLLKRLDETTYAIDAPAKLNLGLRIFPVRADGFHDLESWMVPLSWHDTLTLEMQTPLELRVTGRAEGIPTEVEKNLIGRAALLLAAASGREALVRITLEKRVPPGGGLGGGSSDAASVLLALDAIWKLNLGEAKLAALAAQLGSDVPFFLQRRACLCRGRGELTTPLTPQRRLWAVLLLPPQGLATGPVYKEFDRLGGPEDLSPIAWNQWALCNGDELNERLINDLEKPAFALAPWLRDLRAQAAGLLGRKVHMTGSGSTLFSLLNSAHEAQDAARRLMEALPQCASLPAGIQS